ncbi:YHYH protein [Kordia sp. YSTF-M3]|uniref:YHYH protein n=1 Tax=Kordia aestuariivivens TaxID=2759037 RepID=A0ABR7Q7J3_9FLAO|nr:YHYH protein [Kordia aestuariivivens]MBC8754520.1 YHYH protein [Kordia aestuariivivens]
MKRKPFTIALLLCASIIFIVACGSDDDSTTTTDPTGGGNTATLHAAFAEFDTDNTTVVLNGTNVTIETNGLPNHTSPYWSQTNPLFVQPTVTSFAQMAPGNIDDFNGSYSLTIPATPALASSSSATGLGAIGIAVSGSVIYNDEEGPNVPLDNVIGSLDYTAAHTGPQSYHYHLEPKAWSDDDEKLIGIISDGFFLYGRKCNSTATYPTDLDASGGHTSTTQHTTTAEYHYHIQNELYLNEYYILFPGNYQGTANNIQ